MKIQAFQRVELEKKGIDIEKEEKLVSEFVWCNFKIDMFEELKSYSDASDIIISYSEDDELCDIADCTPEYYDEYYLGVEAEEKASAKGKKNKPKKYKHQEVFDQIVELLELPPIEN